MFPRRPAARLYSSLTATLIAVSVPAFATAQSTDQWRPVGSGSSAAPQTAARQASNQGWQLPNAESKPSDSASAAKDSNPLRKTQKPLPAPKAPEPRSFQPSNNAAPMNAARSSASQRPYTASRPGTINTQAYVTPPQQQNYQSNVNTHAYGQPTYRPASNYQNRSYTGGDNLWDTINVAFMGQPRVAQQPTSRVVKPQNAPAKPQAESLPMPGDGGSEYNDPVMRFPGGPGEFADNLGGQCYQPYCDGSCPTGCGGPCCGDCCEPGCDCPCEPGCDCPTGGCSNDTFCIGPGDDESCHVVKVRWPKWQEVVLFGGVQGFKNPYDRGDDSGNFGFNEGFNIGAKIPYAQLGYQFGYRAAQSQLNGDKNSGRDGAFNQSFVTAGIFHRQKEGLNFGVVWDALVDERGNTESFHQIRSELSVVGCGYHEFGFGATVGTNSQDAFDRVTQTNLPYQASDQYVLFYRLHGCNGGEGKIYAGVNNDSDGIFGADTLVPIGGSFSLQSGFTYLIPNNNDGQTGMTNEAWNVAVGLVWHWDGQARKCFDNCYRPLFNVADNGTLIVDQQDANN